MEVVVVEVIEAGILGAFLEVVEVVSKVVVGGEGVGAGRGRVVVVILGCCGRRMEVGSGSGRRGVAVGVGAAIVRRAVAVALSRRLDLASRPLADAFDGGLAGGRAALGTQGPGAGVCELILFLVG